MELEIKALTEGSGLILPAELLARLGLCTGDTVVLTETDEGFIVSSTASHTEKIDRAMRSIMSRYEATLKELAK